jgi:putative transposase
MIYLLVPKLRKGGYIPFFVTERKRSLPVKYQKSPKTSMNTWNGSVPVLWKKNIQSFGLMPSTKRFAVRCEGHVISMVIAVVQGLTSEGNREFLAAEPLYTE